jgi:proteasome lid subunit RPN8/RPN11
MRDEDRAGDISILNPYERAFGFPRICIGTKTLQKLFCYTLSVSGEISGLGLLEETEDGLIISDVFLIKQEAGAANVVMDEMDLNRFIDECEYPERIKVQWHSHGEGSVFFSSEDVQTIAGYDMDFAVSIVVNRKMEIVCRVDIFNPIYIGLKVPLHLLIDVEDELAKTCLAEVSEKVSIPGIRRKGKLLEWFEPLRWLIPWGKFNTRRNKDGLSKTDRNT